MRKLLLHISASICVPSVAFAGDPGWWSNGVIDDNLNPSPNSPANIGQLKNIARKAAQHLDAELPTGTDGAIWDMINLWSEVAPENYDVCTLAQAKATAKPFYDWIHDLGYDTNAMLKARGYPESWPHIYPWDPNTPASENMVPCSIGQLKMMFSFDLDDSDSDTDTLPNNWESMWGLDPGDDDENNNGISDEDDDFDGDGVSNYQEYLDGTDPLNGEDFNPAHAMTHVADSGNQNQLSVWTPFQ